MKHLHSLEVTAYDSVKDAFNHIVPVVATLTTNKFRHLTIVFRRRSDITSSDHVSHPLDDAIFALGIPSVVVSIPKSKHNNLARYSKIFQKYFPRLHEGKLLQVQCSSGAYNMCMPLF